MTTKPKMMPNVALFNCHLNNAKARAFAELEAMGCRGAAEEVTAAIEAHNGIMGLLSEPHSPTINLFIGMVCFFVNEDREPIANEAAA